MKLAGVKGADQAATLSIVASALRDNDGNGSPLAGAASAAAAFSAAKVRQNLVKKLFPEGRAESFGWALFAHGCCGPCAWCQVISCHAPNPNPNPNPTILTHPSI